MTSKSGDSTEVRSEGERREEKRREEKREGNSEEGGREGRRDDLTVVSDVLWFEHVALFPFKEYPNRFGAA